MAGNRPSSETAKGLLALLWGVYLVFLIVSVLAGIVVWHVFPSVPRAHVIALVLTGPFAAVGTNILVFGLRAAAPRLGVKHLRTILIRSSTGIVAIGTILWVVLGSLLWPAN